MNLPEQSFRRSDESDDSIFYTYPRKVVHIDEGAIHELTNYYDKHLPKNGVYLDLMSAWRSHLPESLNPKRVVGLGMNDEEMADNPQLDKHVVHNLNNSPQLPYEDSVFDAVVCAVSVQYLTQPIKVFQEVNRVLKKDGIFIVSFSNRCFPQKAVAVWMTGTDNQHLALVVRYFELADNFVDIHAEAKTSSQSDPMFIVSAKKA